MPRNPPETPEQWRARGRARYAKHRDAINARRRNARLANLDAARAYHRNYYLAKVGPKYRFGLSIAELEIKLAAQGGRCSICKATKPGGKGRWRLDHCHRFDRRDARGHRGLLCNRCNVAVGMALENPDTLRAAARYITEWNQRQTKEETHA